jgi:hypothetical protein
MLRYRPLGRFAQCELHREHGRARKVQCASLLARSLLRERGRLQAHMEMYTPALLLIACFIMPLWLTAGVADYLCHRATRIEATTGAKESLIHLVMFVEVGVPALTGMFFEADALILLALIVGFVLHEATALWDVSYAVSARHVSPFEQHVHSFLEMIPLMLILLFGVDNVEQLRALVGAGAARADFGLHWRANPLPPAYLGALLICVVLLEVLPYAEELLRGLRANRGKLVPPRTEIVS